MVAAITVNQAAELVGRDRRTLYRAMRSGRLSYTTAHDGHRRIDTSELERCYGPLQMPEPATQSRDTGTSETDRLLAELIEITKRQADEIAKLREEMRELRRLPSPETAQEPVQTTPAPTPVDVPSSHPFAAEMAALRARKKNK